MNPCHQMYKKENLGTVPASNKRPKVADSAMVGVGSRIRQPFSNSNACPTPAPMADSNLGPNANVIEFNSREDLERILNEKMKGKNKNDYKGKSEQMIEYIRKLRTCIRWLMEREDGNLMELERLRGVLEFEEKKHADNEAQMRNSIRELEAKAEEIQKQYDYMQQRFRKEEAEKDEAIRSYKGEKEARADIEKSRDAMSEELLKAGQDVTRLNDHIKVLEANNKRLQEYNSSLQQYNCSLQAEVAKNGETISKMNEEKNSMMGTLTSLRNNMTSMKTQLDTYRLRIDCLMLELHSICSVYYNGYIRKQERAGKEI